MKIEIEENDTAFGWKVRYGDCWADNLTPDEALWAVVSLMQYKCAPYLKTAAQHYDWDLKYGHRANAIQLYQGVVAPKDAY